MTPIGNRIGMALTKTRNLPLILIVSFMLGFAVTIAEPDLQVLAETVPHINNTVLLVTVGLGVGFFLSVCMLRIVTGVKLRWLLIAFYGIVFILASLAAPDFLSVAFDSGGCDHRPDDRSLYSGAGRRCFLHTKRRPCRSGQLRSGRALLHRAYFGGAYFELLLCRKQRLFGYCRILLCRYRCHRGRLPA